MSDLISRQDATTLPVMPKEHRTYQTFNLDDAYEQGWFDLQRCIDELPSAEPKTGWIPVSERLPAEDGEYLVAYPMELGETETEVNILNYGKPTIPTEKVCGRCWYDTDAEYGDVVYDDVVAWMPLPKPYREDGKEE